MYVTYVYCIHITYTNKRISLYVYVYEFVCKYVGIHVDGCARARAPMSMCAYIQPTSISTKQVEKRLVPSIYHSHRGMFGIKKILQSLNVFGILNETYQIYSYTEIYLNLRNLTRSVLI